LRVHAVQFCGLQDRVHRGGALAEVKTTLHKVYGLLGAILPYLYHDKAGAA
jgi:hypothetical protein